MLVLAITVQASPNAYLSATLKNYEPQPAEPGKYVKVFVKLENSGTESAENVMIEFMPNYPFSLDPGKNTEKQIGILGSKSFQVVEYNVKVNANAIEGTHKFKVRYSMDSENVGNWIEKELDISIQTGDAVLTIEDVKTEPSEIAQGETGKISLKISNLADSLLSDVRVKIDLTSEIMPFAPMNSPVEKDLYQMKAGESKTFEFNIIAYPNAAAGVYKIPVEIKYKDNIGTAYTKEELVGVIINSQPDIQIVVDSTTLLEETRTGTIILKIINKGLSDVKLMNLQVAETDDFELLSSTTQEYIGNLDSDDFETVEFKLKLTTENEVSVPINLEYRDNNNKLYSQDMNVQLRIHSASELGQEKSSNIWIIAVIVVLIIGYVIYRRRKNKKRKHWT